MLTGFYNLFHSLHVCVCRPHTIGDCGYAVACQQFTNSQDSVKSIHEVPGSGDNGNKLKWVQSEQQHVKTATNSVKTVTMLLIRLSVF